MSGEMKLMLRAAPVAANAPRFADEAVQWAKGACGVTLDFSPSSLHSVDRIIQAFTDDGATLEDVKEPLFLFGCYLGQVMVLHGKGAWCVAPPTMADLTFPMVIEFPANDGSTMSFANPIGKCFKRFENGPEDDLPYFFSGNTRLAAPEPVRSFWDRFKRRG